MTKIADLLDRDFSTPIEEIIKVNNDDQDTVYTELKEYVATDRIKTEHERLFSAMADAPKTPNEGVGVWISGFFGSGKSSFAKNLGYVLANRTVLSKPASTLFIEQVKDNPISDLLTLFNSTIPCHVFIFHLHFYLPSP